MKKNIAVIVLVSLLVCGIAVPAHSDGPVKKLGRGLANMLTFPMEIPLQTQRTYDRSGIAGALTWGIGSGIFFAGMRALVGVYEVATFPVPIPGDYTPIMENPEFFFANNE